jgi:hypothetical protein
VTEASAQLALAERVAETAARLGIETALIGAAALAAHDYVRGTEDVDLGSAVDPSTRLTALERELAGEGLHTKLRLPDDQDPLGGVLVVWDREGDDGEPVGQVEVVNFVNPLRPARTPAARAIAHAQRLDDSSLLRCVTLPDLIALKIYAGARQDFGDIVELLARNPDADLDAIRASAAPFDAGGVLEELIAEARQR